LVLQRSRQTGGLREIVSNTAVRNRDGLAHSPPWSAYTTNYVRNEAAGIAAFIGKSPRRPARNPIPPRGAPAWPMTAQSAESSSHSR
jgi:hypothetical protein